MSCFCTNFGSNLAPFWQPWTPQIDLILTPVIYPMDYKHWSRRLSYTILLQIRFLVDFGASKTSRRPLRGRSRRLKTAPKRRQDTSKTAQDASGHFQDGLRRSPLFGKKRFSVDNAQWTDQSPQSIVHSSPFTVSYSQFIICKSEFLVQHLQFTVDHSHVTLLCPPHFTRSKIRTHKQKAPRSNSKV